MVPLAGRQVCDGFEDIDLLNHLHPEAWPDPAALADGGIVVTYDIIIRNNP